LPPPKAFGKLRSTAANRQFRFHCSQRHRDAAKIQVAPAQAVPLSLVLPLRSSAFTSAAEAPALYCNWRLAYFGRGRF